jgi:hypothetical protein
MGAEVALYGRGWDNMHNDTAYDLAYPGESLLALLSLRVGLICSRSVDVVAIQTAL